VQVALRSPLEREFWHALELSTLGLGEETCRSFPVAGCEKRFSMRRTIAFHSKFVTGAIGECDRPFRSRGGGRDFANQQFRFAQI
jgi:hypothetical protein